MKNVEAFVVCDPVMMATRGGTLLESGGFSILRDELLPRVNLLTPNIPEAERLLGDFLPEGPASPRPLRERGEAKPAPPVDHRGQTKRAGTCPVDV